MKDVDQPKAVTLEEVDKRLEKVEDLLRFIMKQLKDLINEPIEEEET